MPSLSPDTQVLDVLRTRAVEGVLSSANRAGASDDPGPKIASRRDHLWLLSLILIAAALRIFATRNDLWLDELISLKIAHSVKTPWQIFTSVHSDNNHYLNTIFLYAMKQQSDDRAYRYLSVLWGIALIPAGYWLLARRSRLEALLFSALLTFSYPLIHFSSEARGYSGAVLGVMLACAALSRWMEEGAANQKSCHSDEQSEEESAGLAKQVSVKSRFLTPLGMANPVLGAIYSASFMLALLSHLTAVLVWFALAAASLIAVAGRANRGKWIVQWTAFNAVPSAVLLALYFFDLRFLGELGGSPMGVLHGFSRLLALGLGWPAKDAISVWILLLPLLGLFVWQFATERKSGEPLWILIAAVFVLPLLCTLAMRPLFFSPRYFLVVPPFFYLSLALVMARLAHVRRGRFALAVLLILFFTGQALLYLNFLHVGRGQYRAALGYMMAHTTSTDVSVASNQDFRSRVELAYYAPRVMGRRQLLYGPPEGRGSFQPEWYILHQEGYEAPGPEQWIGPGGTSWHRAAYFGASELSGQAWTIYQRDPSSATKG